MLYPPKWSPDGKRLAFSDKDGKIYVVTIADKSVVEVADEAFGLVTDYYWSPKGGYLAFSLGDWNGFYSLYIWSVADGQLRQITNKNFNEYNPVWDANGDYLFYLADRQFAPVPDTL